MKRIVPLFAILSGLALISGCGLSPKGSVLKKPSQAKDTAKVLADSTAAQVQEYTDSTSIYFAQAEALYSAGVAANQESDWNTAQKKFENSLEILYLMEIDESDTATVERFNRLLREIAYDYKNTLVYLGELADDTSQIIFLEQFYDMQTFKNQDFDLSTESDELTEVEKYQEVEEATQPAPLVHDMPIEWNSRVRKQLDYLTRDTRGHFQEYLNRSGKYIGLMREIIREKGLPEDIVYLPLIESGFNPKAYSWAHASGPWQFISSTGRKYGLKRNWWYDERRDFVKSTYAACDYLKYLYQMFGDWKLALAAYNGGEGRVGRTIKRQRTNDFWQMDLRKQTEDYVPRYMAAVMVAKQPEKYGFSSGSSSPLKFETVEIKHCLDLKEVARKLDIDMAQLRELNPELLRDVTPPGMRRYQLRIPPGKADIFWSHYQDLSSKGATIFAQHKVRKGETLSRLAKKYGTTTTALAKLNGMSSRKRLRAGQYLTVPMTTRSSSSSNYTRSSSYKKGSKATTGSYFSYLVRKHDSLTKIAKKYGTTVSALRKLNGFSSRRILYAGEKIKVSGSRGLANKNTIDRLTDNLVIHIVRNGDTLWKIAQSYGTSLTNLLAWNKINQADEIRPGQSLRIYKN